MLYRTPRHSEKINLDAVSMLTDIHIEMAKMATEQVAQIRHGAK